MSLNDGVLDDLDNPDTQQVADGSSVVIQADVNDSWDEVQDTPTASSDLISKLPNMDVSFKLVSDGATKVVELEDVASEITGKGNISQSDAENVAVTFEGFLNHVRLAEFTRCPSKTNYVYSTKFMERSIKIAKEDFQSKFQVFLENPVHDAMEVAEKLVEDYIPSLEVEWCDLQSFALSVKESIVSNKNLVVMVKGVLTDLRKVSLQDLLFAEAQFNSDDMATSKKALENFQALWKEYGVLRSIVTGVQKNLPIEQIFSSEHMMLSMTANLNICELAEVLSSTYTLDIISSMRSKLIEVGEKAEQVKDDGKSVMDDQVASLKYIIENGKDIHNLAESIHRFTEAIVTLLMLIPNAKHLLLLFASFK